MEGTFLTFATTETQILIFFVPKMKFYTKRENFRVLVQTEF